MARAHRSAPGRARGPQRSVRQEPPGRGRMRNRCAAHRRRTTMDKCDKSIMEKRLRESPSAHWRRNGGRIRQASWSARLPKAVSVPTPWTRSRTIDRRSDEPTGGFDGAPRSPRTNPRLHLKNLYCQGVTSSLPGAPRRTGPHPRAATPQAEPTRIDGQGVHRLGVPLTTRGDNPHERTRAVARYVFSANGLRESGKAHRGAPSRARGGERLG